jgi:hypothetical protein
MRYEVISPIYTKVENGMMHIAIEDYVYVEANNVDEARQRGIERIKEQYPTGYYFTEEPTDEEKGLRVRLDSGSSNPVQVNDESQGITNNNMTPAAPIPNKEG